MCSLIRRVFPFRDYLTLLGPGGGQKLLQCLGSDYYLLNFNLNGVSKVFSKKALNIEGSKNKLSGGHSS